MFHTIPLVGYRNAKGEVVQTPGDMGAIRREMSTVPSPFQNGTIDLDDGQKHSVMIETFRGCPMRCSYCQWGDPDGTLQKFQLEQVLRDIDIVYNNPNVEFAYLVDANLFYTPRTHWKPIVERIRDASRRIPTVATLDIRAFNDEMVELFSQLELAFNQFHFGLQSTNPKALELANRRCSDDLWLSRIKRIREIAPQVEISLDMIYGMPGDDYDGFMETVDFALKLEPTRLYMFPLQVLPGTGYWDLRTTRPTVSNYPPSPSTWPTQTQPTLNMICGAPMSSLLGFRLCNDSILSEMPFYRLTGMAAKWTTSRPILNI